MSEPNPNPIEKPPDSDRRVVRTRRAIGDAVAALFVAEGWDGVTHQRVADHAGVGRNTVYRHFPDRTSLLLHGGHFDDVHHAPITGDLRVDLIEELKAFRRELHDGIVGNLIAAMVERADHDSEIEPMRDALIAAGTRQTIQLIEAAQGAGRMTDAVDAIDMVAFLCGPLIYARLCLDTPVSDAAIEHLVDTHLRSG